MYVVPTGTPAGVTVKIAPLHIVAVCAITEGLGLTVTLREANKGPVQPSAVAVITAVPLKAEFQSITPVFTSIIPALAGNTVYAIPVLLAAVALYVSLAASWQTEIAPDVNTGVSTFEFTTIVMDDRLLSQKEEGSYKDT